VVNTSPAYFCCASRRSSPCCRAPAQGEPPQEDTNVPAVQPVPLVVHTRDVWVQNTGRGLVRDIEIVLNYVPQHYEIWPNREFQTAENPDGRFVIKIASLGSREFFAIVMIAARAELPFVANVRSSEGIARQVRMGPQQILSRPFIEVVRVLLFLGVAAAAYLILRVIEWLSVAIT
jgi:hypothetical protein